MRQIKTLRQRIAYALMMKALPKSGTFMFALALSCATSARADDDLQIARGKEIVQTNCARCHAVGLTDKSTHPDAPPFRSLSSRYPIEDLEEALGEGISTGHPDMPEFVATPSQIDGIIAYIKSLDRNER
ncbi:c-type cytochrome [Mesorhizobium erdmanii]